MRILYNFSLNGIAKCERYETFFDSFDIPQPMAVEWIMNIMRMHGSKKKEMLQLQRCVCIIQSKKVIFTFLLLPAQQTHEKWIYGKIFCGYSFSSWFFLFFFLLYSHWFVCWFLFLRFVHFCFICSCNRRPRHHKRMN